MQIDWLTVGAQALNFLILVLLLRHFLYGRILGAIERRRQDIDARLKEAEREREEARNEAEQYRQERRALNEQRDEILEEARQEAHHTRKRLLEETHAQADRERERWRRGLARQQDSLRTELRQRTAAAVYAAVRRALNDLAGEDLEHRIIERFRRRLEEQASDDSVRSAITDSEHVVVRTAFDLSDHDRKSLINTLKNEFSLDRLPVFEQCSDLVLGIQLEAGDHVIGWTAEESLRALTERVEHILNSERRSTETPPHRGEPDQDRASEEQRVR